MATELVTTTDLGALNARRLADAIVASGAISRAQLARDTGLSKPTVSIALARLEAAGLVREVGRTQGGRGATALLYALRAGGRAASLALDVGRRWVRARVSDLAGRERAAADRADDGYGAAGALGRAARRHLPPHARTEAAVPAGRSSPSPWACPASWCPSATGCGSRRGCPACRAPRCSSGCTRRSASPVSVENDVNLAATAELALGPGPAAPRLRLPLGRAPASAWRWCSTANCARAQPGSAGEVGYLPLLGLDGHSAAPSAPASPVRSRPRWPPTGLVRAARPRGLQVRTAQQVVGGGARAVTPRAPRVAQEQADLLAAGVATVCAIVDPGLVVLGGGPRSSAPPTCCFPCCTRLFAAHAAAADRGRERARRPRRARRRRRRRRRHRPGDRPGHHPPAITDGRFAAAQEAP